MAITKSLIASFAAVGLAICLGNRLLGERFFLGVTFIWTGYAAAGLIVAIYLLFRRPRWLALAPLITIVALVFLFPPLDRLGDAIIFRIRFAAHRDEYNRVVRDVARGGTSVPAPVEYRLDPGPPVRIAFPHPGGFLDNWDCVIHDPTGAVVKAPATVSDVFGGRLVSCRHVEDAFYRCWFT